MEGKKMEFDKVFRALGDKLRLRILDMLMEREMNAGELLEQVEVVQSTLSHHMKSLCDSGLVIARKEGKWTYYSVSEETAAAARLFLERYLREEQKAAPGLQQEEAADFQEKAEILQEDKKENAESGLEIWEASEADAEGKKKSEKAKKEEPHPEQDGEERAVKVKTLYPKMQASKKKGKKQEADKKKEAGKKQEADRKKESGKKQETDKKKDSAKKSETDKKKQKKDDKKGGKKKNAKKQK